jgi:hypothetical protein
MIDTTAFLPGYTRAPEGTPRRATGARPTSRHALCGATPHRIAGTTPSWWLWLPELLSYWGNQNNGNCVTAEQAAAFAAMGVFIQEAEVIAWATKNGVLNGAELPQVMDLMLTAGFTQDGNTYNNGTPTSVDWTNAPVLYNAISQGPVKLGVAAEQLQGVVGATNGWFGTAFTPANQNDEDHSISAFGYGPIIQLATALKVTVPAGVDGNGQGVAVFTWDTVGILDWASFLAITFEAWLRTPTLKIVGTGTPTPDTVWTPGPTPTPGPGPGPTPPIPTPTPSGPTEAVVQAAVDALFKTHFVVRQSQIDAAIQQVFSASVGGGHAVRDASLTPAQWLAFVQQVLAVIIPLLSK